MPIIDLVNVEVEMNAVEQDSDPGRRLERARERQLVCRERYREVIGSPYEHERYAELLEATREVLRCERRTHGCEPRARAGERQLSHAA